MKNYFIFLFFVTTLALVSCGNSSGPGKKDSPNVTQAANSSNPQQAGYGTFTFTMDGKRRTFTAWHTFVLMVKDKWSKSDFLMIEDGGPSNAGFDFKINKAGPTKFEAGYVNVLLPKLLFTFFDTTGVSYIGDDMVVNVTSLDANRLTGTFSGKFVKEKYQIKENKSSDIPQVIDVTDGKFDLHK